MRQVDQFQTVQIHATFIRLSRLFYSSWPMSAIRSLITLTVHASFNHVPRRAFEFIESLGQISQAPAIGIESQIQTSIDSQHHRKTAVATQRLFFPAATLPTPIVTWISQRRRSCANRDSHGGRPLEQGAFTPQRPSSRGNKNATGYRCKLRSRCF